MPNDVESDGGGTGVEGAESGRKKDDILSFREVGPILLPDELPAEFDLMKKTYGKDLTPNHFRRVGLGNGTHLVKFTTPRTKLTQSILRIRKSGSNHMLAVLPSVNPPDIPIAKIVCRPLRVLDHKAKSIVDHILYPDDLSGKILAAFVQVFGDESLEALRSALSENVDITELPDSGEFPIVFIPRPGGGDLQITPVSPAAAFMGMKKVKNFYFQKAQPGKPTPPHGRRWTQQAISAKLQNISGAIGGPRVRFLATMPPSKTQMEAELYRYCQGGSFPRWREEGVADQVMRYADRLDQDDAYNNKNTRTALDHIADQLIRDALQFIADMIADAKSLAQRHGFPEEKIADVPSPAVILIRRRWTSDNDHGRARKALTSPHFEHRLLKSRNARED